MKTELEIEQEFFAAMKRNHGKPDAQFFEARRTKFRQLNVAMGNLTRSIVFPRAHTQQAMKHPLSLSWKREYLDWHRRGDRKTNLANFPKHYQRLGHLSKQMRGVRLWSQAR